jgi:hypothetical protein
MPRSRNRGGGGPQGVAHDLPHPQFNFVEKFHIRRACDLRKRGAGPTLWGMGWRG